jgi:TatD DNase family protein
MLPHPELALARARWHGIRFVVSVVDPSEDPDYTFQNLSSWQSQAAELLNAWASAEGQSELAEPQSLPELPELLELQAPHCRIIIGCHPHNASKYSDALEAELRNYLEDQRTAAIGEIGLDYHYDASPRETQREVFSRQLALAREYGLPVALHLREAHADGLAIMDQVGWPPAGVLLHCFTLGPRELQPFLDRGAVVAFGGTLTFKKADELRQTAAQTALEKIMTETDAPFMTPEPLRGTLCGPEHTLFTAARLAETRSASQPEEVYQLLTEVYQNALAFFDRPRLA